MSTDLVRECPVVREWFWGTFAKATLERTSAPEIEPVALADMKTHLRAYADQTDQDELIGALITAAREWVEEYTARALIDQGWRQTVEGTFGPAIRLHRSPVLAIDSIATVAADGTETALDAAAYELREAASKWPKIVLLDGARFQDATLKIEFRAGYADRTASPGEDPDVVPERFKQAMKLWAGANFDLDEKMTPLLLDAAERLIESERTDAGFA